MSIIENIAASLHHALLVGLEPIEQPVYQYLRKEGVAGTERVKTGEIKQVRPHEELCEIDVFTQTWGSTALGFGGLGGQAITSAYTVIVQGPNGDCCVYFSGRLAYHIKRPNNVFYEDKHQRKMREVAGARSRYNKG